MSLYALRPVRAFLWKHVLRRPALRKRLQKLLYRTGPVEIDLLGAPLTVDAQEEIGYVRAASAQQGNIVFRHEVAQMLSVMARLGDGVTFVDAGANVGLWSRIAASIGAGFDDCSVIAFEPNPGTFARLRANLGDLPNVTIHQLALSDREQQLTFYEGATSGVFSVTRGPFNTAECQHVRAVPLDPLIADRQSIVLKIDVETHELAVLLGAQAAFAEGRIEAVFIDGLPEQDEAQVRALLLGHGFRLFDARSRSASAGPFTDIPLLAVQAQRPLSGESSAP